MQTTPLNRGLVDVARFEAEAHAMRSAALSNLVISLGRRVAGTARSIYRVLTEARQMQDTYRQLSAMTDRELQDIGLTRADIPAVVAGTFRREPAPQAAIKAMPLGTSANTDKPAEDYRIAA